MHSLFSIAYINMLQHKIQSLKRRLKYYRNFKCMLSVALYLNSFNVVMYCVLFVIKPPLKPTTAVYKKECYEWMFGW